MNFDDIELRLRYPQLFEDKHHAHRDGRDVRHQIPAAKEFFRKHSQWITVVGNHFYPRLKQWFGYVGFQQKKATKTQP